MTTLAETAYVTRKFVNVTAIVIVAVLVLRLVFSVASGLWRTLFPPPPPAATMAFGQLPPPSAQNNIATPTASLNYTLETVDGNLPVIPTMARVYFMPRSVTSFGSFDRMKTLAGRIGFTDVPVRRGPTSWRFTDKDNTLRILDIDEITSNFRLTYDYLSDQSIFAEKTFTSTDPVIAQARGFFDNLAIVPQDFKGGAPLAFMYRFDAGALIPAAALSNTDAISVTLTRAQVDTGVVLGKIPVVSPDYKQGLVSAVFSGSRDSRKRILEARFFTTTIDAQNWATYPLVTSNAAWTKLKSGQAIFASLPSPMTNNISIRKIYLAYLDPYPQQSYLQPVLVFSDEKDFVAYVPVVAN